ncbi:MAG: ROK family protein [Actinobacteria bacterium]|nr:ROK family protein [Actinomycetota bacterium]
MTGRALGLDVGGTKVAGLILAADGAVVHREERRMEPSDAEAALEVVASLGRELIDAHGPVVGAGAGVAGMVDFATGVFRFGANLPWRELPLADRLGEAFEVAVIVDNDANAAAWGEYGHGAGRGATDLLMVTVGTGIGGGIVSEGRLLRGAHGFAAEFGHVIVEPGGPKCGCGNLGCWEQVASGSALGRIGREHAAEHPQGRIAELAGDPEKVSGRHVARAAEEGDAAALAILAEVGRRLGEGMAGLANILDPSVIVVGGGVAEIGDPLLAPARRAFLETVEAPEHRPEISIVPAELGNDAGAIGAAALSLEAAAG